MTIQSESMPITRRTPLTVALLVMMLVWLASPLGWVYATWQAERGADTWLLAANLATLAFVVAVPVVVLTVAKRTRLRLVTRAAITAITAITAGAVVWVGLVLYDVFVVN